MMYSPPAPGGRGLEPVPSTKLLPPRTARRLVPREALVARLLDARRQRCVLVQGPAGSGKTSTLVAWRQALLPLDFDVAWLSLAPEDNDLERFFTCLLASLAEVDPQAVREAALLMGRGSGEAAAEHWVISLVQGLAPRPRELVLMLDDVQLLDDPRIFQALQLLLDYAPPNLHLALGSRNAVPLSIGRLRAQGQVSEFDLRDLRFSAEESERFLREQLGAISAREARTLHDLTDGWVAGLQLFAVELRAKEGAGFAPVAVRDPQAFTRYFESEVLAHLALDDLELLTQVSVCNRFCASLCASLLGQLHAVAAMTSRLAKLDAGNLFVSQVSAHDRESWYRVHPLLREILITRLRKEDQRRLHGIAWRWFDAHGYVDEAVRHAVLAGEAEAAADVVEACATDLMGKGELAQLAGLMARLPATQVHARTGLRLAAAYLKLYARDLDRLEEELRALEADAPALAGGQGEGLLTLRAGLALQRDDTEMARALLPRLEAVPDDAQAFVFAGSATTKAWLAMYDGEFEHARAMLAESEERGLAPPRRLVAQALRGLSYCLEGRMAQADTVLRAVLQEADGHGAARIGVAAVAAGLLGDVLYEGNELEAACALLAPRLDVLERVAIPDAVLRALLVLATSQWLAGRELEALASLDSLEEYALRDGLDRMLAHVLALRLRLHFSKRETVQATEVMERIEALAARHAQDRRGTGGEVRRLLARSRADSHLHWHDWDAAARELRALLDESLAVGRQRNAATVHLLLAVAEEGRRQPASAREHVLAALQLGHRLGLVRSLLDATPRTPALVRDLLEAQVLDPVLAFYAQRLLAADAATRAARTSAPAAVQPAADELLNAREREVLELVAQAMPNKKIARVLGVTPHTVKWHLRKIYAKLGVSERDEAVARMRDRERPAGA